MPKESSTRQRCRTPHIYPLRQIPQNMTLSQKPCNLPPNACTGCPANFNGWTQKEEASPQVIDRGQEFRAG